MRERGASLRTPVHGWSMTPFIRDGDVVTIAPLGPTGPRLGEVLAVELAHGSLLVITASCVAWTGVGCCAATTRRRPMESSRGSRRSDASFACSAAGVRCASAWGRSGS